MPESTQAPGKQVTVQMQWGVKIPVRDGVRLNATLYLPKHHANPSPVIFGLTPYVGEIYHERGLYFASHGYPFAVVDVRGRGNSEGIFKPYVNEGRDGYDVIEWLAEQPYCDGQVAMVGGSYGGLDQWNIAREFPPHLATIVPVASPYIAVDFPLRNNIAGPYLMQWLTLVSGTTSQEKIFSDQSFWTSRFKDWYESGAPFNSLDAWLGNPSATFQEWLSHPHQDSYWDSHNPKSSDYAELCIPILTITGSYDGDQLGALTHYREHMRNSCVEARLRHYLVIGPWDHAGTANPKPEFAGLKVGDASLVDLKELHREWYTWTMQEGPKPQFLRKQVAYYVMGLEDWRYTDSLEEITSEFWSFSLQSVANPTDIYHSGSLSRESAASGGPDCYVYDPLDISLAAVEADLGPESLVEQRMVHAATGKHLVYHSAAFPDDVEISGFFRFSAWISIDQPDTDFIVTVFEIDADGRSVFLSSDVMRARYRESLRQETLVRTHEPLRYDFDRFTFISRLIRKGNRLRLVIAPINSIFSQRNGNGGGKVSEESLEDARVVTVRLFHDEAHPSALNVPIGAPRVT